MNAVFTCQDVCQHTGTEISKFHRCNLAQLFLRNCFCPDIYIMLETFRLISKYLQSCAEDVKNNDAYRWNKKWILLLSSLYPTFPPLNIPDGSVKEAGSTKVLLHLRIRLHELSPCCDTPSHYDFYSQKDLRRGFVNFLSNCHHWTSSMILDIKVILGTCQVINKGLAKAERERWERISGNTEEVLKREQKKGERMREEKGGGRKKRKGKKICNSSSTHAANTLLLDLTGLHF